MTRKQYVHKLWNLILAIRNHPGNPYPDDYKIGRALKYAKDNAKNVPKAFGSYEAAWNCKAMKMARDLYMKGE